MLVLLLTLLGRRIIARYGPFVAVMPLFVAIAFSAPRIAGAQLSIDSLRAQLMARRAAAAGLTKPTAPPAAPVAASATVPVAGRSKQSAPAAIKHTVKPVSRVAQPVVKPVTIAVVAAHDAIPDAPHAPGIDIVVPVVSLPVVSALAVAPTVAPQISSPVAPAPVDTSATKVAPVAPPASAKPAPASAPASAPAPAIITGATLSGLLQAWYSAGTAGMEQSFRVRRAEIKLSGRAAERVTFTMMIDVAKSLSTSNTYVDVNGVRVLKDESVNQASRMLQDAFVSLTVSKKVTIDIGQFRVPLSLEGTTSASKLDAIDRALFLTDKARGGGYGDVRDIGLMARGQAAKRVDWYAGLFNGVGESQNQTDRNQQKVGIARVVVRPASLKGLQVGASAAYSGAPHADAPRRDRAGVEMQLLRGRFLLRSEAMMGVDANTHRAGGYVHAGWKVQPSVEVFGRADVWDPNTAREDALAASLGRDMIAGTNWLLAGSTKVQLEVVKHDFAHHFAPGTHQVLVNVQAAW